MHTIENGKLSITRQLKMILEGSISTLSQVVKFHESFFQTLLNIKCSQVINESRNISKAPSPSIISLFVFLQYIYSHDSRKANLEKKWSLIWSHWNSNYLLKNFIPKFREAII